jgi:4-methyl-5(b-hydroxyethyl)-thiazole monophosphate biosynthesis
MVYILLGKGFEEIEAVATMDVLRRGGVRAVFASVGGKTVEGAHGITVEADTSVRKINLKDAEMIIVPGGLGGVESIEGSREAMDLLAEAFGNGQPLAAICAGPRVLAKIGALEGKNAVCYPGMEDQMGGAKIDNTLLSRTDGNIVTGRGPGAATAFGLEVLRFLKGDAAAEKVAAGMTYDLR